MFEERRVINAPAAHPTADEIASVTDVMLTMVRAARGLRMYLPNNPVLIKFVDELSSKVTEHVRRYGELRLEVEPFVLRYKGAEVYENSDTKESIAFRVHSDGIRVLAFTRGIERRELNIFLGIVGFEQPVQEDDDIVTQLWERDLPHIHYLLDEDFVDLLLEEDEELLSQQEGITRLLNSLAESPPLPPRAIPKQFLVLTREDADWLRNSRQAEVYRNPLEDVFRILFAILPGVKDSPLFADFLHIAAGITDNMFLTGEIRHVLLLVRFLDYLRKRGDVGEQQRQMVSETLDLMLSERNVQLLQETIDAGETVSLEEVRELLELLGLPSLPGICELLGRVEKLKMRKVIVEVLVELGKERPEVFAPFLSDPRWYLVRNVVLVLSLLGTPTALEMIVALISHKEQRIRREVLGFLERSSDPKAKPYIVKYLRDDSAPLRVRALQILARERLSFALKPALALTTADDFKTRDLAEKKAVYEAIGELGGERVLPMLREMLLRKKWFQKSAQKEAAICAVAGLLKIRTQAALELLEEGRGNKNPEIRELVEEAIRLMTGGETAMTGEEGA